MEKKIRELNWDDIGKKVVFNESDGDSSTGILKGFTVHGAADDIHAVVSIKIGNASLSEIKPDEIVTFVD